MSAAITANSTRNAASNPRLVPVGVSSAPFELAANETAIGSAPGNDLVIGDPTVSRRHATIT
jgi:pSer/pThr/pTyr-binding forkhead associated (FHA) protein